MSFLSPDVDLLIDNARHYRGAESTSRELLEIVRACYALLESIEPVKDGRDSTWSLWIRTERGRLRDFGDYEEYQDEVASFEEFEALWRLEYPDEVQWRRLGIVRYKDRVFFRLVDKLAFDVDLESGLFSGIDVDQDDSRNLVVWLMEAIDDEVRRFVKDPEAYNRELERGLPLSRRFGRIRRRDLWEAAKEAIRFDDELGPENLELFRHIVGSMDDEASVEALTLADFLGYCAICYQANDYSRLEPTMTPREMYRAMADNRDEGLLEILPDDPGAFSRWYRTRQHGGHPWEICRGGNRTHISLHVTAHGNAWQLHLAGFSSARAIETARMAIALFEHGVPFVLGHSAEMLRMLTGEDFLGIVPEDIPVGYNHSDFPKEDRIHSFIHFYIVEEACGSLPDSMTWYPLEKLVAATTADSSAVE